MGRKLPRAFFWIDQQLIRSGVWIKLSPQARLAYIALSASCDRDGMSIWSRSKLMGLSACEQPERWRDLIIELETNALIVSHPENVTPAIELLPIEQEAKSGAGPANHAEGFKQQRYNTEQPLVIHTHTTIHLGDKSCS